MRNNAPSENVRKRIEKAERSVTVSRIIADDAHPEHEGHTCMHRRDARVNGEPHTMLCHCDAKYFVVRASDDARITVCHHHLKWLLDVVLLAPVEEYEQQEAEEFEHARYLARLNAHTGCIKTSALDPDGICPRPVIADDLCARHIAAKKAAATRRMTPREKKAQAIHRQVASNERKAYEAAMRGDT